MASNQSDNTGTGADSAGGSSTPPHIENPVPVNVPRGAMNEPVPSTEQSTGGTDNAGTSAIVGAAGGTDAAAGAKLAGSKGGVGGASLRKTTDVTGGSGAPGGPVQEKDISPAAGANASGDTGLDTGSTLGNTPKAPSGF